ncbi:MAG: sulfurylase small subunit [Symbiobacterium thermophilum]|uniref:Sulfurylase small subunit n=1 Tax=Symbiobacterium thermophilum TaxID=2734 RepID=A0A953LJN5_SYMTR|nr:sulfurylase small subunit [Symbiobacterium thermophilum]
MTDVDDSILLLRASLAAGERVALATVVHTRGHCPREVGAKMLVWRDGRTAGSIGGGCGENRIRLAALTALDEGRPTLEQVDLLDDPSLPDGAVCGGVMEVLIEPFGC